MALLLEFVNEELLNHSFASCEEFKTFFAKDFKEFDEYFQFGEKTGNTFLYGVSKWVLELPKGMEIDIFTQTSLVPHLFQGYVTANDTLESNAEK